MLIFDNQEPETPFAPPKYQYYIYEEDVNDIVVESGVIKEVGANCTDGIQNQNETDIDYTCDTFNFWQFITCTAGKGGRKKSA